MQQLDLTLNLNTAEIEDVHVYELLGREPAKV